MRQGEGGTVAKAGEAKGRGKQRSQTNRTIDPGNNLCNFMIRCVDPLNYLVKRVNFKNIFESSRDIWTYVS